MVIPEKEETDKVSIMIPSAQSLQRDSRRWCREGHSCQGWSSLGVEEMELTI